MQSVGYLSFKGGDDELFMDCSLKFRQDTKGRIIIKAHKIIKWSTDGIHLNSRTADSQ